ncbi:hypothetical protein MTZ49_08725 [Entomomonas sp. E2T0]|uniref:hypothetical protein n=1 Tax=Entomomonas sp. E2T0 TaxID=2930213 RepID=UPI0022281EB0|nr:hypothetical protein [Entomomonas sp. E2T0]UYZ82700.1 hypothetical protein MTZ49_08725 [Entomomonas sp. E2T0]
MLKKLLNYNKQMIESIIWEKNNDPILFQWQKRGIQWVGSDLKYRKFMCFFIFGIFFSIFSFILFMGNNTSVVNLLIYSMVFLLILLPLAPIIYWGIMESKLYNYHITPQKLELVSWKEDLLFGKQLAQGLLIIITPFLVIVFITEPTALLVSLGGMAGVGILAGATLFSKGYIASHLDYKHLLTSWDKVTKIEIVEPMNIIYIWGTNFYHKKQNTDLFYLFYNKHNKDDLIAFIKQQAEHNNLSIIYSEE